MRSKWLYDKWDQAHANSQLAAGIAYYGFLSCENADTYVAIDEAGNESLFITLTEAAAKAFQSPRIAGMDFTVEQNDKIDRKNKVLRISMNPKAVLEEAFEAFSVSLVTRVAAVKNKNDLLEEIYDICQDYSDFFGKGGKTTLGPLEEQGLFGELLVLSEAIEHFGDNAVECWVGQDKNRHDFVFKGDNAIEVKTSTKQGRQIVTISNDHQLESRGDSRLFLKLIIVEKNPSGTTIAELIDRIMSHQLVSQSAKRLFERKLLEGKVRVGEVPAINKYVLVETHNYLVDGDFPRLSPEKIQRISPRIYGCKYKIDLTGLSDFREDIYEYLGA